MQTILGSGGAIGTSLARELHSYTKEIRLVSRDPARIHETDHLFPADITDPAQVDKAVRGSEVCYLTVGLKYSLKTWRQQWIPLTQSVVDACVKYGCRLVFFSNVYAIGADGIGHITEDSPIAPSSKKGEIRSRVERIILERAEQGKLEAIVARSPEFFGPVKKGNSAMMRMVYDNLRKGRAAQWFCRADKVHTMGYTPDLAKATALLGNTPSAFSQVWNLPADPVPLTGREWVELFAEALHVTPKITVFPGWSVAALGLFLPVLKELHEMLYQYDRDYVFDSSKFRTAFNFAPTTNREAVKETVRVLETATSRVL
jgi:nucleoside-diphosphate-sugar epimerase